MEMESRGLFRAPHESEEQFRLRVALWGAKRSNHPELLAACQKLRERFGIFPDWVECEESWCGMLPWYAALTWVAGCEAPPRIALHPLWRRLFRRHPAFWQEVLCHELLHAVRAPLAGSGRYEEWIAYLASSSLLRRFLGPIFSLRRVLYGELVLLLLLVLLPQPELLSLLIIPFLLALPHYLAFRKVRGLPHLISMSEQELKNAGRARRPGESETARGI